MPYHHGDLRQALVDAAIGLLRESGPEALTLRGVARAAGVSQAAPYRHFDGRRALVAAVAEDGFRRLHAAITGTGRTRRRHSTRKHASSGHDALRNIATEYVRFAHSHPAEYRVMFGEEIARDGAYEDLATASRAVFDLLSGGIASLQAKGIIRKGDPDDIAIGAWAMMHGLVMLSLDGQTTVARRSLAKLTESATQLLMYGMAAPRGRKPLTPS